MKLLRADRRSALELNKAAYASLYAYNNPEEARRIGLLALDAARRERNSRESGKAAKVLAMAYSALGDRTAALQFTRDALTAYQRAASVTRTKKDREYAEHEIAKVQWSLAHCHLRDGQYDSAERILRKALQGWPQTVRLRARLALARNRPRRALRHLDRALALAPREYHNQSGVAILRARAYLALEEYPSAVRHASIAVRLIDRASQPIGEASFILAQAFEGAGRLRQALRHYKAAASSSSGLAIRRADRRAHWLAGNQDALNSWLRLLMDSEDYAGAWEATQSRHATIARDMMAGNAIAWSMVPEKLRHRENALRQKIIRLQEEPDSEESLHILETKRSVLFDQALDSLPFPYAFRNPEIRLSAVRGQMKKGEVLLSFASIGDRTAFWVISRRRLSAGYIEADVQLLAETVSAFMERDAHHDFSRWFFDTEVRRAFHPVLDAISSMAARFVTIVPSPQLWTFPFHLLKIGDGERLGEKYPCRYLPFAGAKRGHGGRNTKRSLVIGDPRGDLPYARDEAREISSILRCKPLIGAQARRTIVMKALRRANIVHFAGHGRWDEAQPDLAGLELFDRRLGPLDLLSHDLSHIRVMSLMGCETGRVRVTGNELTGLGVMALAAGCHAVVEAVTPVADAVTPIFARAFHSSIASGTSPARAFQIVLRTLMNEDILLMRYAAIRVLGR